MKKISPITSNEAPSSNIIPGWGPKLSEDVTEFLKTTLVENPNSKWPAMVLVNLLVLEHPVWVKDIDKNDLFKAVSWQLNKWVKEDIVIKNIPSKRSSDVPKYEWRTDEKQDVHNIPHPEKTGKIIPAPPPKLQSHVSKNRNTKTLGQVLDELENIQKALLNTGRTMEHGSMKRDHWFEAMGHLGHCLSILKHWSEYN